MKSNLRARISFRQQLPIARWPKAPKAAPAAYSAGLPICLEALCQRAPFPSLK